ncbi:hypothetical protein HRbin15_00145 [bacterium HR15]|nr:hypothetical protein HRbin15_00145 [bacterium HR15]
MTTRGRWWLLVALAGSWLGGWAQAVELIVQPLFGNKPSLNGAFPLRIEVRNRSGNMRGVISVAQEGFNYQREYLYPIELPAGARKQLIACPLIEGYGGTVIVRFVARGVTVEARQSVMPIGNEDSLVVGVGDAIGGLQFLRNLRTRPRVQLANRYYYSSYQQQGGTYEVAYCRPEHFPPSTIACSGVSVILLGAGAERMSSEQWRALLDWVRLGGTLIVPGGPGALYLQHPVLRPLLPVQVQGLGELPALDAVGTFAGHNPPLDKATVTLSRPAPGGEVLLQQNGVPLIARRPYGLGVILFLAFSPWDQPMRSYEGNPALWQRLLQVVPDLPPSYYLRTLFQIQTGFQEYPYAPFSPSPPYPTTHFNVRMPAAELIIGLLLAYFVLVVPVNYYLLRRFRALDWSWLTVPLIAVLFVLVLSRLAGDLYRKPLSGEIRTALLMNAGDQNAYAVNSILLFFPKAGLFDFRFEQSDMVEAGLEQQSFGAVGTPTRVSTVESEPKRVQGYRVRSLSLQWFRYTRPVQLQGTVESTLRLRREGATWRIAGTIRNTLPYDLRSVRLMVGETTLPLGNLPSGGTLKVDRRVPVGLRPAPRARPQSPPGYYFPGEFMSPTLTGIAQQWSRRLGHVPVAALLTAEAEQPVLAPEMSNAFQHSARTTYLVAMPL